jgi:divalent metal cation (Fe/Co/Zn/Cd) transporter
VLAGILIIKGLLFRHVQSVRESIGSAAVKSDAGHHISDALTSAFAFVGISIAILGGPGWEAADVWVWTSAWFAKWGSPTMIDLHIVVLGEMSVREGHRLSHKVEAEVLKALPQVAQVLVYVEPEKESTIKTVQQSTLS